MYQFYSSNFVVAAMVREIRIGQFNPTINVSVSANVHSKVDLQMVTPSYVFATPFFGGQASVSLPTLYGVRLDQCEASSADEAGATLTQPFGRFTTQVVEPSLLLFDRTSPAGSGPAEN